MTPPLSKNHKDSTRQRAKIYKSTQFYLYQISHLHFKKKISLLETFFALWLAPASRKRGLGCGDDEMMRRMLIPSGKFPQNRLELASRLEYHTSRRPKAGMIQSRASLWGE